MTKPTLVRAIHPRPDLPASAFAFVDHDARRGYCPHHTRDGAVDRNRVCLYLAELARSPVAQTAMGATIKRHLELHLERGGVA